MREPSTLAGCGRFQTSVQFSEETRDYLHVLAIEMGVSRADVLEYAIREMARSHLPAEELASLADPPGSRLLFRKPVTS